MFWELSPRLASWWRGIRHERWRRREERRLALELGDDWVERRLARNAHALRTS